MLLYMKIADARAFLIESFHVLTFPKQDNAVLLSGLSIHIPSQLRVIMLFTYQGNSLSESHQACILFSPLKDPILSFVMFPCAIKQVSAIIHRNGLVLLNLNSNSKN